MVRAWHEASNNLVLVTVENEDALLDLLDECHDARLTYTYCCEPDLNDAHTALALISSEKARRLTCDLPLALRAVREEVSANA